VGLLAAVLVAEGVAFGGSRWGAWVGPADDPGAVLFAVEAALGVALPTILLHRGDRLRAYVSLGALAALGLGAQVGVLLPYGRAQESEADHMGVLLMAKAGYDPRDAIGLWQRMNQAGGERGPEFLSTHPNPENRIANLHQLMPQAWQYYQNPQLPLPNLTAAS
jgi:predicted Zn-dependent protease